MTTSCCTECGSGLTMSTKTLCRKCYQRKNRGQKPRVKLAGKPCSVEGCETKAHARGFCRIHYKDWWRKHRKDPKSDFRDSADRRVRESTERQLAEAHKCYDLARSPEARKRWLSEIRQLTEELSGLKKE